MLKLFLNRNQFVAASPQVQVHIQTCCLMVLAGEWATQDGHDRPKIELDGLQSQAKNRTPNCIIL